MGAGAAGDAPVGAPRQTPGAALRRLLGTGFGSGWLPLAPGTWGSLAALLLLALAFGVEGLGEGLVGGAVVDRPPEFLPSSALGMLVLVTLITALVGWKLAASAEADYGRPDPPAFVLDEWVGQAIAVMPLVSGPFHAPRPLSALGLVVAFGVFRVLDAGKPWPVSRFDRLPGGVGIMSDDVVAGGLAALVVMAVA